MFLPISIKEKSKALTSNVYKISKSKYLSSHFRGRFQIENCMMLSKKFLVVIVVVALVMALQVEDGEAAAARKDMNERSRSDDDDMKGKQ